jgi:arsenite-transporting ATPase
LAAEAACRGGAVLVVSTDPAHSLGDCLGAHVADEPVRVVEGLWALQIDPERSLRRFLVRTRGALHAALDRGTYLDDEDINGFLDLPLPGIDEVTSLIELMRLLPDPRWRYIVVDTAPTGHTERLLQLPGAFASFGALLDALQARHRFMIARLAGSYIPDEIDETLDELRAEALELQAKLHDPAHTAVLLAGGAEPVVQAETERYLHWLHADGLPICAVIVNQWDAQPPGMLDRLRAAYAPVPVYPLPRLRTPIDGLRRLRRFGTMLEHGWHPRKDTARVDASVAVGAMPVPFSTTPIQFIAGKGGVGKSTLASLNALALASNDHPALLVSLDPAHSLGDVWAMEIGDTPVEVAANLWALEVDAAGRWDALRRRWQNALQVAADDPRSASLPGWRETTADLTQVLDLLPPGVDEVIGMFVLADLWDCGTYRTIVVDCAPTGHFLRLLQSPELALEWVRMLMRLVRKYREVVSLETFVEELIGLSRQLKAVSARLRNPAECAFLPVAIPEKLSVMETQRLVTTLETAEVAIGAIVLNKLSRRAFPEQTQYVELLRGAYPYPLVEVPLQPGLLRGKEALRKIVQCAEQVGGSTGNDR